MARKSEAAAVVVTGERKSQRMVNKRKMAAEEMPKAPEVKRQKKSSGSKKAAEEMTKAPEVKRQKRSSTSTRGSKKAKDPNMPKRAASAFLLFMTSFRQSYKEEHPDNKSVTEVAKASGSKWRSMTDEEKKPFEQMAAAEKTKYAEAMAAYESAGKKANENETEEPEEEEEENKAAETCEKEATEEAEENKNATAEEENKSDEKEQD